jgi:hypothetical protein
VADETPVEFFTNHGGTLAPASARTYGGVATTFLITSRVHEGPYQVIARVGWIEAAPSIMAMVTIHAKRLEALGPTGDGPTPRTESRPAGESKHESGGRQVAVAEAQLPEVIDVAISYARPNEDAARKVRDAVDTAGYTSFFDRDYQVEMWGADLAIYFQEVFARRARFCVIFLSDAYLERNWTNLEAKNAISKFVNERGQTSILPIQVEKERLELPGLPALIGDVSLEEQGVDKICAMVVEKLRSAGITPSRAPRD